MRGTFHQIDGYELQQVAHNLVADVTLHNRKTEEKTGGDFGFTIMRPQIKLEGNFLNINDYQCGILCQAKMKSPNGKWGILSRCQKDVLPKRLHYLGLLLYSYEDKARYKLNKFLWQLCNSASLDQIKAWLKNDNFPSLVESDAIIQGVGNGTIGTDDVKTLDEIISPVGNQSLTIRIYWPKGKHPGSTVQILTRIENENNKEWCWEQHSNSRLRRESLKHGSDEFYFRKLFTKVY